MGSASVIASALLAGCLLLLASAAHGSGPASTTTALPTTSGGGLPPWVQRLLAVGGGGAPTLGSMEGRSVVVSKDSSGQFRSINAALEAAAAEDPPTGNKIGRYIIYLKEGVYEETVNITRKHVIIIGEGAGKSVITGSKSVAFDHLSTPDTATVSVYGRGFMAQDITIRNTAGPAGKQAVALMSRSHYSLVYRCSLEGYQDTVDADTGLQMYLETSIHGTVDFVFGYARAAFLGCRLLVRHSGTTSHNVVTAQGRSNPKDDSGFAFQNCSVTADQGVNLTGVETFLGRPWKNHSHVMFMESFLDSIIDPQGWVEWNRSNGVIPETVLYLEYGNRGPGADTARRVKTPAVGVANCSQAEGYTADRFVNATQWVPAEPKVTIPYPHGLQNPCRP